MEKIKIMMDGEPLEAGDRVYSLSRGHGEVIRLDYDPHFPIACKFAHGVIDTFTEDFKLYDTAIFRVLYWQKPEITPPPKLKPKKKIKVWDWFVEYPEGRIQKLTQRHSISVENMLKLSKTEYVIVQKIDGTEREIEVEE